MPKMREKLFAQPAARNYVQAYSGDCRRAVWGKENSRLVLQL